MPVELRRVLANVTAAYRRGDARVREDAEALPRQLVFVDKRDLASRAIEAKALTWDRVPKAGPPADGSDGRARPRVDPQRVAVRIFGGIDGTSPVPRKVLAPPAAWAEHGGVRPSPAGPSVRADAAAPRSAASAYRFRDWNPDLRVARELGVHIEYSGARNEIRCPELTFSSRDRDAPGGLVPHLTSRGIAYGPATSVGGDRSDRPYSSSGSGSSGSSGSAGSSGSSVSGGSSASSSRGGESKAGGESKGGEGGRIKN
jgi:hypothetical protein